jgi:hypothetical protein
LHLLSPELLSFYEMVAQSKAVGRWGQPSAGVSEYNDAPEATRLRDLPPKMAQNLTELLSGFAAY